MGYSCKFLNINYILPHMGNLWEYLLSFLFIKLHPVSLSAWSAHFKTGLVIHFLVKDIHYSFIYAPPPAVNNDHSLRKLLHTRFLPHMQGQLDLGVMGIYGDLI